MKRFLLKIHVYEIPRITVAFLQQANTKGKIPEPEGIVLGWSSLTSKSHKYMEHSVTCFALLWSLPGNITKFCFVFFPNYVCISYRLIYILPWYRILLQNKTGLRTLIIVPHVSRLLGDSLILFVVLCDVCSKGSSELCCIIILLCQNLKYSERKKQQV